jgi:hypothetical protein
MITIDKDIKITIDKADVPVFINICQIAQEHLDLPFGSRYVVEREGAEEIEKFLNIIFEKAK